MGVHVLVHRHPGVMAVDLRVEYIRKWSLEGSRVAFRRMIATTSNPPWTTEELAKARRRRHLLDDNPASG